MHFWFVNDSFFPRACHAMNLKVDPLFRCKETVEVSTTTGSRDRRSMSGTSRGWTVTGSTMRPENRPASVRTARLSYRTPCRVLSSLGCCCRFGAQRKHTRTAGVVQNRRLHAQEWRRDRQRDRQRDRLRLKHRARQIESKRLIKTDRQV